MIDDGSRRDEDDEARPAPEPDGEAGARRRLTPALAAEVTADPDAAEGAGRRGARRGGGGGGGGRRRAARAARAEAETSPAADATSEEGAGRRPGVGPRRGGPGRKGPRAAAGGEAGAGLPARRGAGQGDGAAETGGEVGPARPAGVPGNRGRRKLGRNAALKGRKGAAQRPGRQRAKGRGAEDARPVLTVEMASADLMRRARRRALFGRVVAWGSFLVLVVAPTGVAGWYLYTRAADQYASELAFAVRSLEGGPPAPVSELLGGAVDSTSGDSQILYEFLQSQPLVKAVDARLDLREIYSRPEGDPVFSIDESVTVEGLTDYWNRAVTVAYDSTGGIIEVEVKAFRPEDAQSVAAAVLDESAKLINGLSVGARADAVRFAEVDLAEAEARVREARLALQAFRSSQGTADVSGDISQEMGLIGELRARRADLQADIDSRRGVLADESPVLGALERRLASLDQQIAEAEGRIADDGMPGADGTSGGSTRPTLAEAAGVQERLQVELELATNMYTAAQGALEAARADARRAQRYLATHIEPTLAEQPRYPERMLWTLGIFGVAFLLWSILGLIWSSIRDRA